MNILTKLTLRFSIIAASILVLFSLAVYLFSAQHRLEEFYQRLEGRAVNTAKLHVSAKEVDKDLLQIINENSVPALAEELVLVFDQTGRLIYRSGKDTLNRLPPDVQALIRIEKTLRLQHEQYEVFGTVYTEQSETYVVVASAHDRYGHSKMGNLRTVLLLGLLFGMGIIVLAGRLFAKEMLSPLANINDSILHITAGSLHQRLDEGNRSDEIARLAMNFNLMLERLEQAFEVQRSFVSNASHELRTPLAVIQSQLQVTLGKERPVEEYQSVLHSLLDDTLALSELANGLLLLARSGMEGQRQHFKRFRTDEALFNAQEELARLKPNYHFQFDYGTLPENEHDLILTGNERLLTVAFINLMDNACKFSPDHTVHVSLTSKDSQVELGFRDNGAGIPPNELDKVFNPFFRGSNVQGMTKGHGIGLSLCKKIVELHRGQVTVQSLLGKGSRFKITLPMG